jgi:hypothetical protein
MFRRGQGCPRFFCGKDGGTLERVRGMGLLIRRAIPEVYQGYTKTIDKSTSQDGRNTQNISHPMGILGMVTEC